MTTDDPTLDDDQEPSTLRAKLDEASRARNEAESELARLRAKDLFRDAGIDPSKPLHAAAMRGYDGELTSEAVQAFVTELGINQPSPPAEVQNPATADEMAAHDRIANAGAGDGAPPPTPDRRIELQKQIAERTMKGASIQEIDELTREFSRAGGFPVKSDYE